MLLPRFDFHEPTSLNEACAIMLSLGKEGKIIAGGTDLIVNMKKKIIAPKNIVSLARIPGLREINFSNDHVAIGCQVTVAEIAESEVMNSWFHLFVEGARSLGSPLIRNRATVAGNVITARPAADTLPSLIALGATLLL